MEKYRPTPEQIEEAKRGSNELFEYDVPDFLQPNNIRHVKNLAGYSGLYHGIMYIQGIAPQRTRKGTL